MALRAGVIVNIALLCAAAAAPAEPRLVSSQIIGRDFDSATQRNVYEELGDDGLATLRTNHFVVLGSNMHYFEAGEWKTSEDVIESFPGGAIARRGPNQAIFAHDLAARDVFDILLRDGTRLRGGVRAIQVHDAKSGLTRTLGTVRSTAEGEILPPNQILYRNAFDGVDADVVYVWRHNYFSQDVILRALPDLPLDVSVSSARLEIVTEFLEPSGPKIPHEILSEDGAGAALDHPVIDFGAMAMIMGKAYRPGTHWTIGSLEPADGGLPVLKLWVRGETASYLIESIALADLLGQRQIAQTRGAPAAGAAWSGRIERSRLSAVENLQRRPMKLAAAKQRLPEGYVVDFVIVPSQQQPVTFLSTTTYYLQDHYYTGNNLTFQAGTTLKFKDNKYLLAYGALTFQPGSSPIRFTSRNDDLFGDKIVGVTGEADSDGDASKHRASQALWVYYVNFNTTVQTPSSAGRAGASNTTPTPGCMSHTRFNRRCSSNPILAFTPTSQMRRSA